jgi:hypothetical protein
LFTPAVEKSYINLLSSTLSVTYATENHKANPAGINARLWLYPGRLDLTLFFPYIAGIVNSGAAQPWD